ncbi:MAG: helix-turn-helix transcriptional regulator [Spirochaetes bacterium]|nr:helix-turn-helix transcriptional regulator [Spirochaetota bacterium]
MKRVDDYRKIPVFDILKDQYREADNKADIDFWIPLTKIIMESLEIRSKKNLSQTDLARLMRTRQSTISRFENMGRKPNYEFLSRLAIALEHSLGMTLYGDYMAVVPEEKQDLVKVLAKQKNISTVDYTQNLLDMAITSMGTPENELENGAADTKNVNEYAIDLFTEGQYRYFLRGENDTNPDKIKLEIAAQYCNEPQIA